MKRNFVAAIFSITLLAASAIRGQAPDASDEPKLLVLVKEVQAQQAQIARHSVTAAVRAVAALTSTST